MASYSSPSSQARTSCGTSLALRFRTSSSIVAQRRWQLNCSPTTSVTALEMHSASRPATYKPSLHLVLLTLIGKAASWGRHQNQPRKWRELTLRQCRPLISSASQRFEVNFRVISPCPHCKAMSMRDASWEAREHSMVSNPSPEKIWRFLCCWGGWDACGRGIR